MPVNKTFNNRGNAYYTVSKSIRGKKLRASFSVLKYPDAKERAEELYNTLLKPKSEFFSFKIS